MTNPDSLCDAIRDTLRAIPGVVALVAGNADRITAYADDETGLVNAVYQMPMYSILVAWTGNEEGEVGSWRQRLSIYLKIHGRLGAAFTAIVSGIPVPGDGQRFSETQIHPDFFQLGIPVFVRDTDEDNREFPRIDLRFQQTNLNS